MVQDKFFLSSFVTGTALTIALIVLTVVPLIAAEIRYPVSCYEGQELEKVREWEKTWVGKKIDINNIDAVKEFVPDSMYQIIKNPGKWGDIWFEIVPYREIVPTPGTVALTKKYAGTVTVGPQGEIINWVSGTPFPEPKNGIEVAYNFDTVNMGDNMFAPQDAYVVDGLMKYDRKLIMNVWNYWFYGRRDIPPVPEVLPNPKQIRKATTISYEEPAALKGTRNLVIKWKDDMKDYGSWTFSSASRRIARRSTAQRMDSVGGGDNTSDDNLGWDWRISSQTYKLLGRKEILIARHQDLEVLKKTHKEGYCVPTGLMNERVKAYEVETIHKDPNYIYSKQIWYIDPESWWIIYAEKYDRQGRLWKIQSMAQYLNKSKYNGIEVPMVGNMLTVDVQRVHSTYGAFYAVIGETGPQYRPDFYTPNSLQREGY